MDLKEKIYIGRPEKAVVISKVGIIIQNPTAAIKDAVDMVSFCSPWRCRRWDYEDGDSGCSGLGSL
jgi:hypothetical protein